MKETPHDVYIRTEIDRVRGITRLTRTAVPYPTAETMLHMAHALVRALPDDAPKKALIDFRLGPPARSDDAYEEIMARTRRALTARFEVVAVLVRSAVGKLQVSRIARA